MKRESLKELLLSKALKEFKDKFHLSDHEVGKKINVFDASIYSWIKCRCYPTPINQKHLIDMFYKYGIFERQNDDNDTLAEQLIDTARELIKTAHDLRS